MLSQMQADKAVEICERISALVDDLDRQFAEMKRAADEFERNMEKNNERLGSGD